MIEFRVAALMFVCLNTSNPTLHDLASSPLVHYVIRDSFLEEKGFFEILSSKWWGLAGICIKVRPSAVNRKVPTHI